MKLYWGPNSCAIGIHILLEELGTAYETEKIDVSGGATHEPAFLAVNPKAKVPTLVRDDGSVLTEFNAIATWLARAHSHHNLLPVDPEGEARVIETVMDACGTDTEIGEETSRRRMERAGVWLTSTNTMIAELVQDWSTPQGIPLVMAMTAVSPMLQVEWTKA